MRMALRIVSLLIAGTLVFVAGLGGAGLFDIKNPFQSEAIDRSQPALLKSVQDISQFHAAVGNFEVVLDYEDDVNWLSLARANTLVASNMTFPALRPRCRIPVPCVRSGCQVYALM